MYQEDDDNFSEMEANWLLETVTMESIDFYHLLFITYRVDGD